MDKPWASICLPVHKELKNPPYLSYFGSEKEMK